MDSTPNAFAVHVSTDLFIKLLLISHRILPCRGDILLLSYIFPKAFPPSEHSPIDNKSSRVFFVLNAEPIKQSSHINLKFEMIRV